MKKENETRTFSASHSYIKLVSFFLLFFSLHLSLRQRFVRHAEGVQLKFTNVAGFRNLTSFLQRVNKFHTMSNY